jgi:hypothetical protein
VAFFSCQFRVLHTSHDFDPVHGLFVSLCGDTPCLWGKRVGVHVSAKLQNVISAMKLLLVSILVVAAVGFVWGNPHVLERNMHEPFKGSDFSGFGVSCVAALWAFSGW